MQKKLKTKKSNLEKQKLQMQMQLIENAKSEVDEELENQKEECLKLSRKMGKLKNSWRADAEASTPVKVSCIKKIFDL